MKTLRASPNRGQTIGTTSCALLLLLAASSPNAGVVSAFRSSPLPQQTHRGSQSSPSPLSFAQRRTATTPAATTPTTTRPLHLPSSGEESGFGSSSFRLSPLAMSKYPGGNKLYPKNSNANANTNTHSRRRGKFSSLFAASSSAASDSSVAANKNNNRATRARLALSTILRVAVPSVLAGVVAFLAFPQMSLWLCSLFRDQGVFAVLSQDSSQFVQNFLSVASLLFSILVGQTYYFLYQQQEMVYYALFDEVTEAKSLLEQVALVSQGRSMYQRVLKCMSTYVQSDLKALDQDPAVLLSSRPMDDPLETIMYLTSVGVPSTVYETVRSLRQARAQRLGALQRKLPAIHFAMLWMLAALELVSFPLLGAGTQTIGGYNLLTIEGLLFGVMTTGIVLTLRVVGELWRPAGGAYQVDSVLKVMVRGLERELEARTNGSIVRAQQKNFPSSSS